MRSGDMLLSSGGLDDRELPEVALRQLHDKTSEHEELVQADGPRLQEHAEHDGRQGVARRRGGAVLLYRGDDLQCTEQYVWRQLSADLDQLLQLPCDYRSR